VRTEGTLWMGVRPRVQKHRRPRERGVQYRLQRDPALKLRSMISESPSGRLVACSLEVFSFFLLVTITWKVLLLLGWVLCLGGTFLFIS
jgi:hypothetical protein